jgi:penicillin amidase
LIDGKNETVYTVGSSNPGIPYVLLGRSKYMTWGVTASLTDVSDLYREKLDEDEATYLVDGE